MSTKPKSSASSRTVLEPVPDAQFTVNSAVSSLALSTLSDTQSLIYIGTFAGTLILYSLNTPQTAPSAISFLKSISVTPSPSPVISIHLLPHVGKIIVSAADGFLYLVDSSFVEPSRKLSLSKGVTAVSRKFCSRSYNSNHLSNGHGNRSNNFFAIGVGKKLVFAELVLNGSLVISKEIQGVFDGVVVSLVWVNDSVIFGTRTGCYLYNCVNGQCSLIFSLQGFSSLPLVRFLPKDWRVLLIVDNVGTIADMDGQPVAGSLAFNETPDSLTESGSYIVAVRKGVLELYHKESGRCVQTINFVENGGGKSFVMADNENGGGRLVAVATSSKVICYSRVSAEEQIKDPLRRKCFKEAILLAQELESQGEITKEMLSFIHAQLGFLLLFDLRFEEAVDHFLLSDTMQPSELFPFILRDPNRWTLLVPRNRYWGLHPPPTLLESVVDDGLMALQRAVFLKKAGVEIAVDDEFLLNTPNRADLLESAIKSMIRYLQACRDRDLSPSVREGVDTLLIYLYRALNRVDDMERLASSENSCIVEELESLLNESGHLRTLAFLYAGKGMSSKALAIWRILARNYSSSNYITEPYERSDIQDSSTNIISGRETAATEASRLLEESSDQDLVLQHLGWIADINQMLAVQVLISEKRTNQLPPDEVIAAIDPKKVEILQRYLQWLIEDQESDDARYHTAYARLLANSALEAYEVEHASQGFVGEKSKSKMSISESGKVTIFESPVRQRLQIFLQSSDLYDPEDVLDLIEESELWLEKAILYRKLGQETLVLQILALKLEDYEAAEQYCVEIGRPDAYMQLLEMYLDPNDGREPMFKAAVRLLHYHGEVLDPLQVLERLSPDIPLQLASDTILKILRARLHHHHQGQIVHNISSALEVDASLARLEERSRHVLINEESVCDSCHARLGTKLFAMYPDDTIVCYKCFRRQGDSTSVSGRDFKRDVLVKPGWLVTR